MKIKQTISVILLFCCILLCASCGTENQTDSEDSTAEAKYVLKAWTGEFSEEKLKEAISVYKAEYTPITLDDSWQIVITIDEVPSSYRFPRISYCGDSFEELNSYIDLAGISEYNDKTHELTIDCSWLNNPDSWIYDHNLWSYLINFTTDSGENIYYYVRVTFDNTPAN